MRSLPVKIQKFEPRGFLQPVRPKNYKKIRFLLFSFFIGHYNPSAFKGSFKDIENETIYYME